jgi:small nuclear ribonucleoprotein (snRNP)-like protein
VSADNIRALNDAHNKDQVDLVTGMRQRSVTIELMNDRLTMLGQLKAVVMHMTRPLLELQMVERGLKDVPEAES